MIYYDATYLAKYYLAEPDSPQIRARAESAGCVGCCLHGRLEVASVIHRKLREGTLPEADCVHLHAQFTLDCADGLWTWFPVTTRIIELATASYTTLSKKVFLRAADALHLTCASENGFAEVFSSDRHLLAAAPHFRLTGVSL